MSGDDVEVVLRLPGLRILDLCKVSERLPCDGPGPPNEARPPSPPMQCLSHVPSRKVPPPRLFALSEVLGSARVLLNSEACVSNAGG